MEAPSGAPRFFRVYLQLYCVHTRARSTESRLTFDATARFTSIVAPHSRALCAREID